MKKLINIKNLLSILIILAAIYNLFKGDITRILSGIAVLIGIFVLEKINKKKHIVSENVLNITYVYLLFALVLGVMLNFYRYIAWYDYLMHLLSGILVAVLANDILYLNKVKTNKIIKNIFIISVVCLSAVMWEMYEYTVDILLNMDTQNVLKTGVVDTMEDIISAFTGGILVIINPFKK